MITSFNSINFGHIGFNRDREETPSEPELPPKPEIPVYKVFTSPPKDFFEVRKPFDDFMNRLIHADNEGAITVTTIEKSKPMKPWHLVQEINLGDDKTVLTLTREYRNRATLTAKNVENGLEIELPNLDFRTGINPSVFRWPEVNNRKPLPQVLRLSNGNPIINLIARCFMSEN